MTHGKIPENFFDAWPNEVTFSTARRGRSNRYKLTTRPPEDIITHISSHEIGEKDGSAWSAFDYDGDVRDAKNCRGSDFVPLDIDNGTPLDQIEDAVRDAGLNAAIVSTHSHGATHTAFSKRDYVEWRKSNSNADDEDFLRTRAKGYHSSVWRGSAVRQGKDGEPLVNEEGEVTVDHQPCERYRIVVPLAEPFLVSDFDSHREARQAWEAICHALAKELRLKADPNTFDLARMFYDPRHPANADPVTRFVAGEPFDGGRALARATDRGGRSREKARPRAPRARQSLPMKVFNGDLEVLRSALMTIKNDERFAERRGGEGWIKILGAISCETDHSDEGLDLAHMWSKKFARGDYDEAAADRAWDTVRDDHPNAAAGGTIRKFAMRDGWTPPDGFPWGDGWTKSQIVFEDEREVQEHLDSMNAEFAVVKSGNSICILHECKDADGAPAYNLLREDDFKRLTRNRGVVKMVDADGEPTKGVPVATHWLASPQRREHMAGLVFRPGEELRPPEGSNGWPRCYNIWQGWGVEPSERGSCRLFKDHLRDAICGGDIDLFNYMLDWMAHLRQRPLEKPGVALVFIGPQGAGKSIVGRALGKLVGRAHYFVASQEEQLTGKHNAHLGRTLLVQGEEAFFVHDAKSRRVLKDLITRETKTVEPKNVDVYTVDSFERYILTSNDEAVVHAGKGERRFTVFHVRGDHARETEYFAAMIAQLEDGGYERLTWELLKRDIRGFDCRQPFETEALAEQKLHALDSTARWMLSELASGELWEDDRGETRSVVDKKSLSGGYRDFAQRMRIRHPLDEARLGKWITQFLRWKEVRPRSGNSDRRRCYRLPDLTEARRSFVETFEIPASTFADADGERE